jgi:hypothetical protein
MEVTCVVTTTATAYVGLLPPAARQLKTIKIETLQARIMPTNMTANTRRPTTTTTTAAASPIVTKQGLFNQSSKLSRFFRESLRDITIIEGMWG